MPVDSLGSQLDQLGLGRPPATNNGGKDELGQADFLKLMIAQFQHQDPFKPMQNGEFLGQMAQFGTVSGIQELQQSFSGLATSLVADQTLQASGLLGRDVLVASSTATFDGETLNGAIALPEGVTEAMVEIKDANGSLVARVPVSGEGLAEFQWDGATLDGGVAPAGAYTLGASLTYQGQTVQTDVLIGGRVESVVVNRGTGPMLLTDTLGSVSLADVHRIQ